MFAGIVLYNPDLDRLQQNVFAILPQVKQLLLVDNGSSNYAAILDLFETYPNIKIIHFECNKGVAAAQNVICEFAKRQGHEWAITLDQDSVSPNNLVSEYYKILGMDYLGMICPKIVDRNFGEIYVSENEQNIVEVDECIASASAIRISAWEKVGGFYEPLFIDKVDFDICQSLRECGYKIMRTNRVQLLHEVGHSRIVHYVGKDWLLLNHSPLRYYYIIRNAFIIGRRHGDMDRLIFRSLRTFYQVLRYEDCKLKKAKMMLIGFYHGIIGKEGKYGK